MVAGEDGVGQVVEALEAAATLVALAKRLSVVSAVLDDRVRHASGAGHAAGPPHVPDGLVALGVVKEFLDVDQRMMPRSREDGSFWAEEITDRRS